MALINGHGKAIQSLVAGAASAILVLTLIAIWGAGDLLHFATIQAIIFAIAGVAGLAGLVFRPIPWYLAVLLGAVIGLLGAFSAAIYLVSNMRVM
ncbi:MAG TPA: hypothetical protein ENO16_02445 [Chromatiales bacterium]|nr:hypothetical protein [Chromatiales bacterium]